MMQNSVSFEALKEVARWIVFAVISWVVAETLKQSAVIPEVYELHVWELVYAIPVRGLFVLIFTVIQRAIDRLVHESEKIKANGVLPF